MHASSTSYIQFKDKPLMEKALYIAAMEGNVDFLSEVRDREIESGCWNNLFQSLTPQNNNIAHIASQYDQFDFLKYIFNFLFFSPLMIFQRNANGDTPIHVASKRGKKRAVEFLVETSRKFVFREVGVASSDNEVVEEEEGDNEGQKWAWRVQNLEGNTPVHEALINGKLEVAKCLLEVDPHLASFVNNNGETPLHLAIRYNVDGDKETAIDTIAQLNKQQASLPYKGCWLAEESAPMISVLLQKYKDAVYTRDKDGLTPLLRAGPECHVAAVELILKVSPESSEMCDPNGKTFLHLLKLPSYGVAKKCMKIPQLFVLKDQQDDMGNTPAHIAVMNCLEIITMEEQKKVDLSSDDVHNHLGVIRALLESSTNFSLKNKQGLSAAALLQQLISRHFPNNNNNGKGLELDVEMIKAMLRKNHHVMEEFIARNKYERPETELGAIWKAVMDGDVHVLRKELKTIEMWLLDEVLKLGDVVCVLLEAGKAEKEIEELVKVILEKNPLLISQTNIHGDTLLHTMLHYGRHYQISDSLLDLIKRCYDNVTQQHNDDSNNHVDVGVYCPPWKVKNVEGNTILHEALLHVPKSRIVNFLLQCDTSVAKCVNNRSETPLHVLCRTKGEDTEEEELEEVAAEIIEANVAATYDRDNTDGYTPLLRAAKEGKIEIVKQICRICGNSAQLRDREGKTLWHLMDMFEADTAAEDRITNMFRKPGYDDIRGLLTAKDNHGNTPLFLAIENHNYNLARVLKDLTDTKSYSNLEKHEGFDKYNLVILETAKILTPKMERILWGKMKRLGEQSIFGVKEDDVKEYVNTIGVIAALLATIAFTVALAVPGGFESNTGDAVILNNTISCRVGDLSKGCTGEHHNSGNCIMGFSKSCIIRSAYWVFMVADILTMCFSITILYCLLWVLKGDKKDKLIILDFTIALVHPTLSTTMVTLMMGVFATTFRTLPELAIFTVIACSITLLVFQRWVVKFLFKYVLVTAYLIYELLWEGVLNVMCRSTSKD